MKREDQVTKSFGAKVRETVGWAVAGVIGLSLLLAPTLEKRFRAAQFASGEVGTAKLIGFNSASIGSSTTYSFAYYFAVDGRDYCAGGSPVPEGGDPEEVCADRYERVKTRTYKRVYVGETLPVVYDPEDPSGAELVEPVLPPHYWYIAAAFMVGVAVLAIRSVWYGPLGVGNAGATEQG